MGLYASEGRPSVPPEQLLLASLLQAFYGIRSERLLLDQLHYNLLFRWFVGLSPDDPIWHPTTFTKNRERLLNEDVMGKFLEKLMDAPEVKPLLSADRENWTRADTKSAPPWWHPDGHVGPAARPAAAATDAGANGANQRCGRAFELQNPYSRWDLREPGRHGNPAGGGDDAPSARPGLEPAGDCP